MFPDVEGPAKTPANREISRGQEETLATNQPTPSLASHSGDVPRLPAEFGRYRILGRLGQGGMGAVYLAHDTQLDRRVALKVPTFSADEHSEVIQRFYREARAAATLWHPNICPVYDVGQIDGIHYLTMAYIEGRPLSDFIQPGQPWSERQAATLVRKLASALAEAHVRGIVHRDMKPSNVMLDEQGEPLITDFGLARTEGTETSRITQTGAMLGTPAYMSPEQVLGETQAVSHATDIYSLGVILYELLTGRLPFAGVVTAVIGQILTAEPPSPQSVRPGVHPQLAAVCLKAMAKKIEDRYATATDFIRALDASLGVPSDSPDDGLAITATMVPASADAGARGAAARMSSQRPFARRWSAMRSRRTLVALGVGLLLLVLGAVVIRLQNTGGTLVVEVNQPDARVQVSDADGKVEVTQTSTGRKLTFTIAPGTHRLKVEKEGFEFFAQEFVMKSRGEVSLSARLEPATPRNSTLVLRVDQTDALVEIADQSGQIVLACRTVAARPLPVTLGAGNYRLKVKKPGFADFEQAILLASGATKEFEAQLTRTGPSAAGASAGTKAVPPQAPGSAPVVEGPRPAKPLASLSQSAQERLKNIRDTVKQGDLLRAAARLDTLAHAGSHPELEALAKELGTLLEARRVVATDQYLLEPNPFRDEGWNAALAAAEQYLVRYDQQVAVVRVRWEDSALEPEITLSGDGLCFPAGGGHGWIRRIASGDLLTVAVDRANPPRESPTGALRVGGLYHCSPAIRLPFERGKAVCGGDLLVRAVPPEAKGRLVVRLQPEAGLSLDGAKLEVARDGFYYGLALPIGAGNCAEARISPGTYELKTNTPKVFQVAQQQRAELKPGGETEVALPAFRPREAEIDWCCRNGRDAEWQRGKATFASGITWHPPWNSGSLFFYVSPWDGTQCTIQASNAVFFDLLAPGTELPTGKQSPLGDALAGASALDDLFGPPASRQSPPRDAPTAVGGIRRYGIYPLLAGSVFGVGVKHGCDFEGVFRVLAIRPAGSTESDEPQRPQPTQPPSRPAPTTLEADGAKASVDQVVQRLRDGGKASLADELAKQIEQCREKVKRYRSGGGVIVGRVVLEGAGNVREVNAQMEILDDGYFVGPVGDFVRPVGFRLHGFRPVDLQLAQFQPQQTVAYVGDVRLAKLSPHELARLKGRIQLEDGGDVSQVRLTFSIDNGPTNTPSNGTSPRSFWPEPQQPAILPTGEFTDVGYSPAKYYLSVSAPGYVRQWKYVTFSAGHEFDVGTIALEKEKPLTIAYYLASEPPFTQSARRTVQIVGGSRWKATPEIYGWDLEFRQNEGQVTWDYSYAPCYVTDLGPGKLDDFLTSEKPPPVTGDPRSIRPQPGHVYLVNQAHWKHWILLQFELGGKTPAPSPKVP